MPDFLTAMSEASGSRARAAREGAGKTGLRSRAASAPPPRRLDLQGGFDLIAEAKLASPSEGRLIEGGTQRVIELARAFADSGAAAVSVLTEESSFGGALEHLRAASAAIETPVMRKDFLVDPIQVLEARAAGASGVLLIARILPGALLEEMVDLTLELGMFALVEVFDLSDLEDAASVSGKDVLIGVNCRDLATLEVEFDRFESLFPHLPSGTPAVAESGVLTATDAARVAALGYRLALVGSSLVSSGRPAEMAAELIAAGTSALMGSSS